MQKTIQNKSLFGSAISEIPDHVYDRIRRILKTLAGFQLRGYKDTCIKRRICARIRAVGCASAEEYAELLLRNKSEVVLLIKTLTIHVSKFFRNSTTFDTLRNEILPSLFSLCMREEKETLNILSLGCATGEEPYTLAMILHDSFAREMSRTKISMHAADIDPEVLSAAAEAVYEPERLEETPEAFRDRYFVCQDNKYRLIPEIRNMVSFHRRDILKPEPLQESDLILCRNVLIYFERSHQEELLKRFAHSLRNEGILVLGKTETLMGEVRNLYRTICSVERIYRKK